MAIGKHAFVEGRVRDVVSSGEGVVETAQGILFTRGVLTGERVRVALDGKPGRVRRARLVSVLEPSPARIEAPCRYAARCGGCALMHASLPEQRRMRLGFLRDALVKAGASESLEVVATVSEQTLGYRRRARLSFQRRGKVVQLGFRRERSHDLVDVELCLVLEPTLSTALTALREELLPQLEGEGELRLGLGSAGPVAVLTTEAPQPPGAYVACARLVEQGRLGGLALFAAGASKPALYGDAREWSRALDDTLLEGTVGGFSQAHGEINARLVARVAELAQTHDMRVLELYAGSGNFTVALAPGARSYTAIEQASEAAAALRRNLAARGLEAKVLEGDAAQKLAGGPLDVVVLDPPRTGAPGVLRTLATRKPRRIVYVSCDPATLGRDLGELDRSEYRIAHAEAFEMFPQTAELESLVLLERHHG